MPSSASTRLAYIRPLASAAAPSEQLRLWPHFTASCCSSHRCGRHPTALRTLLQKQPFVPVPQGHLSQFWNRDSPSGTKGWRLLSRVAEPGQNVPHAKKILHPAGFDPKTSCLVHGFLANSPK